jgi:hypothetical protein
VNRAELTSIGAAVVLHLGLVVVGRSLPVALASAPIERAPLELVEIVVPDLPRDEAPRMDDRAAPPTGLAVRERPIQPMDPSRSPSQNGVVEPGADPVAPPAEGPVVTAPEGAPTPPVDDWSAPEAGGPASPPGLGTSGPVYLQPGVLAMPSTGPAAPTATPKAAPIDRRLADELVKEELRKNDRKLGLDFPGAGTIANFVRSAVQSSTTPQDARASLQVRVGPNGAVQSVKIVTSVGGDAAAWQAVAAAVKAQLASQKLALSGDYAKGALVTVNVTSKLKMPSGATLDDGFKVSNTQSFDVADIGARPTRVVNVTFSAQPAK